MENSNVSANSNRFKNKLMTMVKSTAFVVLLVTIVMTVIVHFATGGNFYTAYNLSTYTRTASFTILIGCAQTLVLLLGGIDLSVASIAGLSRMVFAMLTLQAEITPFIAILVAIIVGFVCGAINGVFICGLNLPPFIVTLATSSLYKGIIYVCTQGVPLTGIPDSVTVIGQGSLFGVIPYPTLIMIAVVIILMLMLKFTSFGRHIYAVGGNTVAAKIVGVRTNRAQMGVYSLGGLISGMTGVLMVLRMGASQVNIGENWVMPSITAAVLGGTAMSGGMVAENISV